MALTVEIRKRLGSFSLETSFRAEDGETLALLGASGCGKSVTLKCIAGILQPDEGHIELDGRVLYDSAADPAAMENHAGWTCRLKGGGWATSSSSMPSFPT